MTLLKLKAKIYQYTGLYLAKKEEDVAVRQFVSTYYDDMDNCFPFLEADDRHIFIGSWQADNGFHRFGTPLWTKITMHRLRKNKARHAYYSVLGWLVGFYLQLRSDCEKL
jgi:hypothetical protein